MLDGMFVFDNVIHVFDMSDENLRDDENLSRQESEAFRKWLEDFGYASRWPGFNVENTRFSYKADQRWTIEECYKMQFVDAPLDMAMTQVVPIFDWFNDYFAPVKAQAAMAAKYPDRVLFCGGIDPVHRGLQEALDFLEYQVKELGAVSVKFYNGHLGKSWACDDEEIAYPIYEKCRDLGVKVLQFHKGIPLGNSDYRPMTPLDLERPARDFPDLSFVIHHLALPMFDEVVNIAGRHPNIYLALSGNLNSFIFAPRMIQEQLGQLLQQVGSEKLFYGSESPLTGSPAPYLRAFLDLEIPEDLRRGYGYPQITREDQENILGLSFARLMGIDVEAKKAEFAANPVYDPAEEQALLSIMSDGGEPALSS